MKSFKRIVLCIILSAVFAFSMPIMGCSRQKDDEPDEPDEPHVSYGDFGAVGDGKTDDFAAIKAAHDYANDNGVAVKADSGAKYYIGAVEDTITVKTNVYFGGAEFIIDDRSAQPNSKVWWYPLFSVKPDTMPQNIEITTGLSLESGQKNIGLTFDKPYMLAVYNEEKRDFIRHGFVGDTGAARQEIILVDKDGNVDGSTPIQWDYDKVTKITAYSIDDKPVTLRGGKFTTIANDDPKVLHYFERGISVERANVTVKGVSHYVTGEGDTGSPYNGFFRTKFADNVTFENCVMTGHKIYVNETGGSQGTYDTRLTSSNNVRYLNCTQTDDHTDPSHWGIMCSDYCKNLRMDGCKLSRFDAHKGVYNATIINSDIGQNISVTGGGLLRVENVTKRCAIGTYYNRFVTLREDYGSFFYGDIIIKDSVLLTGRGINYVVAASWYDWDFGYECRFPKTLTLDNVRYEIAEGLNEYIHPYIYIFSHVTENERDTPEYAASSKNPPTLTEKVIIKNNSSEFRLTANTLGWFAQTEVEYSPN